LEERQHIQEDSDNTNKLISEGEIQFQKALEQVNALKGMLSISKKLGKSDFS